MPWNKGERKEHYALFAKSFADKKGKQGENVFLFDLKEIEKMMKAR